MFLFQRIEELSVPEQNSYEAYHVYDMKEIMQG